MGLEEAEMSKGKWRVTGHLVTSWEIDEEELFGRWMSLTDGERVLEGKVIAPEVERYGRCLFLMEMHSPLLSPLRTRREHPLEFMEYGPLMLVEEKPTPTREFPFALLVEGARQEARSAIESARRLLRQPPGERVSERFVRRAAAKNNPVYLGTKRGRQRW